MLIITNHKKPIKKKISPGGGELLRKIIQIRGPNIPDQGSAYELKHDLKDLHLRMAFQCLKARKLHSITIKSKDYSFGCGRGHWGWVVCCPDTILSIRKCVGLKLITLTQHYTNLSLISILLITAMMKENIHLTLNR